MDKLPPELKMNILEKIESIADLKQVRLVSKDFAYYAADSLFSAIFVFMTESSFVNLEEIARHPLIRHKVYSVVFFPAVLEDRYSTEEAYLRQVSEIQYLDGDLEGYRLNFLGRIQLTADEKEAGHARCVSVCKEQSTLRLNGETRLRNAFSTLPKLDHVATAFTEDYLTDGVFIGLPKTLQSILTDCHMPFGQHADGPYNPEDFFMLTRAIAGSGTHLRTLRLSNDPEGFDCGFLDMSDADFSLASNVFSSVTSLVLVLDYDDDLYLMDVLETGCCRRLLKKAPLTSLTVGIGSLRCALPILPPVFGTHTWQKLRRLTLDNVGVDGFELTTFLQRHKSSLRHLSLVYIYLATGSWYDVLASLQTLELRTLSLCGLSIPIPSLPDLESKETISDPHKVWEELDAWLRRVPWSPELEVRYIHGAVDWTL